MWMSHKKRGLRQFVLAILSKGPRNGAEIMNDMEAVTHGWWRPSPGSVYPLLDEMVNEGALRRRDDGRYELARAPEHNWGWPATGPRTVEEAVREIAGLTAYLEDLKRSPGAFPDSASADLDKIVERLRKLRN